MRAASVQGLLLPVLLKWIRQERILMSAVVASTLEMAGFAIAPMLGPWAVYAAIIVGAPGSMAFPVISALKSVHAGAQEQGRVQVRPPSLSRGHRCSLCLHSRACAPAIPWHYAWPCRRPGSGLPVPGLPQDMPQGRCGDIFSLVAQAVADAWGCCRGRCLQPGPLQPASAPSASRQCST